MPGFEHLANEFLQDLPGLKTIMLIGRDCILAQRQRQFTNNQNKHQIASETPLGWCIMGRSPPNPSQRTYKTGHQSGIQNRPRANPRAQIHCAWCKDNNRMANHPTKHCDRFHRVNTVDKWAAIDRQEICAICLIGSHSPSHCPDYQGKESDCQQCKCYHSRRIACRLSF